MNRKFLPLFLLGFLCTVIVVYLVINPTPINSIFAARKKTSEVVFEVDFIKYLESKTRNKNEQYYAIIREAVQTSSDSHIDFYDALSHTFSQYGQSLSPYFGAPGQTDNEIIDVLKRQTRDALDYDLLVLKKRIEEFGWHFISVELANNYQITMTLIHSTEDAVKKIFETPAQLDFHLVGDDALTFAVLQDIDSALKERHSIGFDFERQPAQNKKTDKETELSLDALFGRNPENSTESVTISKLSKYPLFSLLRVLPGKNNIYVPEENISAVDSIFHKSEVQIRLHGEYTFLWGLHPINLEGVNYFELYFVTSESMLSGSHVLEANVEMGERDQPVLNVLLDDEGTHIFHRVTEENVGRKIAIVLDNKVATAPIINAGIPSGRVRIDGLVSIEEAKSLVVMLRSGPLPVPLRVVSCKNVKNK